MSRKIILGTDWWTDCDDVVAARVLTEFAKAGVVEILGVIINTCTDYSASSVDAFFRNEGIENLPIGIDRTATFEGKPSYQKFITDFCGSEMTNDDAEDGVRLYRKLLSQVEGKAELVDIGFHQVLYGLLKSAPDDISPLDGLSLVKEKVSHFWAMAGKWDVDKGTEYNIHKNEITRIASAFVFDNIPCPMTLLGFEVGEKVLSGNGLKQGDMLYEVLKGHMVQHHRECVGRSSWDPMTVLLACIGNEDEAGYKVVRGKASVNPISGENSFIKDENGTHCYVVKKFRDKYYSDLIDAIIAK